MALHGEVKVNGDVLYAWCAVRRSPVPREGNEYAVTLFDAQGNIVKVAVVDHLYGEGALVLAAKVLAWASRTDDADQDATSRADERTEASKRVLALPWEPHGVMLTPYVDRERAAAAAGGEQ